MVVRGNRFGPLEYAPYLEYIHPCKDHAWGYIGSLATQEHQVLSHHTGIEHLLVPIETKRVEAFSPSVSTPYITSTSRPPVSSISSSRPFATLKLCLDIVRSTACFIYQRFLYFRASQHFPNSVHIPRSWCLHIKFQQTPSSDHLHWDRHPLLSI